MNVSAVNLEEPDFCERVLKLLVRHGLPASNLAIELTESALMRNPKVAQATLERLARAGHTVYATARRLESIEDLHHRINDEDLDIDETCVMVLKNCGPKGYPGMAEVGNMPLPPKILKRGITDMIRISDARMSGTAYGTVVLHTAPEAAAGGPLALVQNGDLITLDVEARSLHLQVEADELDRRRAAWEPPAPHATRGYAKLYIDHVVQADDSGQHAF